MAFIKIITRPIRHVKTHLQRRERKIYAYGTTVCRKTPFKVIKWFSLPFGTSGVFADYAAYFFKFRSVVADGNPVYVFIPPFYIITQFF